jgi:hypothetical protein
MRAGALGFGPHLALFSGVRGRSILRTFRPTATVKSIDPDAFMDQAASDHVLALRVLHAGSIIMTHAVTAFSEVPQLLTLCSEALTALADIHIPPTGVCCHRYYEAARATERRPHVEQGQQPAIERTDLQRHDLDVPGREVVQVRTWTQQNLDDYTKVYFDLQEGRRVLRSLQTQ